MQTECLIDILKDKGYIKNVQKYFEKVGVEVLLCLEYECESKDVINKITDTFQQQNKNDIIIVDKKNNNQVSMINVSKLVDSIDFQLDAYYEKDKEKIIKDNYEILLQFKDFQYTNLNQEKFIDAMNMAQDNYRFEKYIDKFVNLESKQKPPIIRVIMIKQKMLKEIEKQKQLDEMKNFIDSLP